MAAQEPNASSAGLAAARAMAKEMGWLSIVGRKTANAIGVMFDNFATQRDSRVTELLEANNRLVEEKRAALRALREMTEWRPIKTAPPSVAPTKITHLLLTNGFHAGVGFRQHPDLLMEDDPEWCDETGEFIEPQPTHWMPMPAAPAGIPGELVDEAAAIAEAA